MGKTCLVFLLLLFSISFRAQAQVIIADAVKLVHADGAGTAEIIVDNGDASFFITGDWTTGNFGGGYEDDYIWTSPSDTNNRMAFWQAAVSVAGDYDIYAWYPAAENRGETVHYRIQHENGASSVVVDQTTGGNWEHLGRFSYNAGDYLIQLSNRVSSSVVENITVDNGDLLFSTTGSWSSGTFSAGYQDDYLYTGCSETETATATWDLPVFVPGNYEVIAILSGASNRYSKASYTLNYSGGALLQEINQSSGDSKYLSWFSLGTFPFEPGNYTLTLSNEGEPGTVVLADAVLLKYSENQEFIAPLIVMLSDEVVLPQPGAPYSVRVKVRSPVSSLISVTAEQEDSEGTATVELFDDGAHNDGAAGDDIFGGQLPGGEAAEVLRYRYRAETIDGGHAETPWLKTLVAYDAFTSPEMRFVFGGGPRTPEDVDALLERVRDGNMNAVCVNVRNIGDALYESSYEPKMPGIPEGFDPLAYLIEQAHDTSEGKQYIEVHPLVLVYRILVSDTPPQGHVLDIHPEWTSENYDGEQYVGDRMYIDQGIPEVQDYLMDVFGEIIDNYDIDGFNLDFIRYREQDFGYNSIALDHFHQFTGRSDRPAIDDPQWSQWRRDQVTTLVKRVYAHILDNKPDVLLTIDGIAWYDPKEELEENVFYWHTYQDYPLWLREHYIDGVLGMAYRDESTTESAQEFRDWHQLLQSIKRDRQAVAIAGAYKNRIEHTLVQLHYLREAGSPWLTFFSDRSSNNQGAESSLLYEALQLQIFPTPVPVPKPEWRKNSSTSLVYGKAWNGEEPARHATIRLDDRETRTDLTGFFAFFDVVPGEYEVEWLEGDESIVLLEDTIAAGEVDRIELQAPRKAAWQIR